MHVIDRASRSSSITTLLVSASVLALAGCGGSSSGDAADEQNAENLGNVGAGNNVVLPTTDTVTPDPILPSGDITRYGAINVADDIGVAADVVGSFFLLREGVSAEAVNDLFAANAVNCQTFVSPEPSIFDLSAGFLPRLNFDATAISVGPTLSLNTPTGTYATLEESEVGQFLFYSLPINNQLPDGAVPSGLTASIDPNEFGISGEFAFGDVEPLVDFDWGQNDAQGSASVFADTLFSWTPAEEPGQLIRIETQTLGGFFAEESLSVNCVVPDTGSFIFPSSVQDDLGQDFEGSEPLFSRLGIQTTIDGTTAIFTVRESF